MINRIRFRNALYKLIVFKNIVENKVHKEKMSTLFAFEQLIINTEEMQEIEEHEEHLKFIQDNGPENLTQEELMKNQIMKLTNVSSSTSQYILQALLAA